MSEEKSKHSQFSLITGVNAGEGTVIHDMVNLYKCTIGKNCKIDAYVYIEEDVVIGNNCKIRPFVFMPTGVTIEDNVFIGPHVVFTNDKHPKVSGDWELLPIKVKKGAAIGAGAVILPGVTIGENAIIGAGAVVSKDVADNTIMIGNPSRLLHYRK